MRLARFSYVVVILATFATSVFAEEPTPSLEMKEAVTQLMTTWKQTDHPYTQANLLLVTKTFDEPAYVDFIIDIVAPTGDKRYAYIIRQAAAEKLSELKSEAAIGRILERLKTNRQPHVKVVLVKSFGMNPSQLCDAGIIQALQDSSKDVKAEAARWAGKVNDVGVIPLLIPLLNARYADCRLDAYNALTALTGNEMPVDDRKWQAWWDANKDKVKELPVDANLRAVEKIYTWPMAGDYHFGCRQPSAKARAVGYSKARKATQAALEDGLEWLSKHQAAEGYWDVDEFWVNDPKYAGKTLEEMTKKDENKLFQDNKVNPGLPTRTGPGMDLPATGLALMAFCGAGYTHRQGKFRKTVQAAMDWVLKHQNKQTGSFSNNMYIHAICAHAIIELWGVTRDPALREPAQRSLDFLCWAQKPRAGWRYGPRSPTSDSSVSSWCSMALQTGYRAGLEVPTKNLIWCREFWDKVTVFSSAEGGKEFGQAFYELNESDQHGGSGSHANTAASILCRLFMGTRHRARSVKAGAAYLDDASPSPQDPNIYMWIYATQGLYQMGGPQWARWEKELIPAILRLQSQPERRGKKTGEEGSFWCIFGPSKHIGANMGRVGMTAACCIILETYYFYPKIKNE